MLSITQFTDVSDSASITKNERTWGASWGDFNGDTLPDIYVSNHQDFPSLYLNQGDGTFVDIAPTIFPSLKRDNHGAAWADFDNDGDADLIQVTGADGGNNVNPNSVSIRNQLYVNNAGQFEDQANKLGAAYPLNRGRMPLWVDIDKDGSLDLVFMGRAQNNGAGKSTVFRQIDNQFVDIGSSIGFNVPQSPFGFLADLSGDDNLELNIVSERTPWLVIYEYDGSSLINVSNDILPEASFPRDIGVADFNGDLITDLYFARTNVSVRRSAITVDDLGRVVASLTGESEEIGYNFGAASDIIFDLFLGPPLQPDEIYIGANGLSAENFQLTLLTGEGLFPGEWRLEISPDDARVFGLPSESERQSQEGIYIGFEPSIQQWTVLVAGENKNIDLVVSQDENNTFTDIQSIGFSNIDFEKEDILFFGSEQGFEDKTDFSNINSTLNAAKSVATGDFDNDMDVDIYTVTTELTDNTPNILYENQGDGTFLAIADSGDAEGTRRGRADAVVTADYDLDGFLDLFLTNGAWPPPLAEEGPHQLLRNNPNGNHWLEIDLEGVVSNRDGIGARVYVTAGGVTQVREQSGGTTHLFSQNHQRLHFGLAEHATVDTIVVVWPNGHTQEINNISANQLIRIVEETEDSSTQGIPTLNEIDAPEVFLWKETFDGPYKLRILEKPGETVKSTIDLIANKSLKQVQPIKLNPRDSLIESEFGFSLSSTVQGFQDGVDFQLEPGTSALLSVSQNGVANPRQLSVGSDSGRLSPAGWILDSSDFPKRPDFNIGDELGLFIGQGEDTSTIEFRWNSDGLPHRADLNVLTSRTSNFTPVSLGVEDDFVSRDNEVRIKSRFQPSFDGFDINLSEPTKVGFTYEQDSINQPHRINRYSSLGFQNAYELPIVNPYGRPNYDRETDKGLFLWKDEVRGLWKLRASAGGSFSRFSGRIISDQPFELINGLALESTDVLDTSVPTEINFNLSVGSIGVDGIDFRLPIGASVELNLGTNSNDLAQSVKIGAQQWEVSALPLDLSGWDILT